MKRQTLAALIGAMTIVGVALWMRDLASWRPVRVVPLVYSLDGELSVSRDGQFVWVGQAGGEGQAFWLYSGDQNALILPPEGQDFAAYKGLESWPRLVRRYDGVHFQLRRGAKEVHLPRASATAFSLSRGEIYAGSRIWNMSDGTLKKRVRYDFGGHAHHDVFSPDGCWLLSGQWGKVDPRSPRFSWQQPRFPSRLRRYDVQTGRAMPSPNILFAKEGIGRIKFSPDGKFFLLGPGMNSPRAVVFDAVTWKKLWRLDGIENADWLPDNRVGVTQTNGLEWRDAATGVLVQTRSGLIGKTLGWTTSFEGKWVYAINEKREIYRYRAR